MNDRTKSLRRNVQEKLISGARFEQSAFIGWLYTSVIDRAFVDHELSLAPRVLSNGVTHAPTVELAATQRITSWEALNTKELYAHLKALLVDANLVKDSFCNTGGPQLAAIGRVFAPDALNILVIGAGCSGLAVANGLQASLGGQVRILVVEKRILKPHVIKPYSRDWLTFIRLNVLEGLVHERVFKVLSRVGDQGFMGVPLNVFETLLLESCNDLGVKFLFDQVDDYSSLIEMGVDLVIDATGNRLIPEEAGAESPGPTFTERNLQRYGEGYGRFGITRTLTDRKAEVETVRNGNMIYPAVDGRRMKLACFKLTNVPIRLYQSLLDFVRGKNQDSRFYIWPGMLKPEINALLLIINLHKREYDALATDIAEPVILNDFLAHGAAVDQLENDVIELMKMVARKVSREEAVKVEPPFIFAPYLKPYQPDETFHGKPLIRVGDSIFNGNPKTGNGLSRHLAHLSYVRDCITKCI